MAKIIAFDIDAWARKVTRETAELNKVDNFIEGKIYSIEGFNQLSSKHKLLLNELIKSGKVGIKYPKLTPIIMATKIQSVRFLSKKPSFFLLMFFF